MSNRPLPGGRPAIMIFFTILERSGSWISLGDHQNQKSDRGLHSGRGPELPACDDGSVMATELRDLMHFVRVADLKSVSQAATELRLAQPALSRHIRSLEVAVGVSLFQRHGRGVILTKAGERFYERVRSILRDLTDAVIETREISRTPIGETRLCILPHMGPGFATSLLRQFRQSYSAAKLTIVERWSLEIAEWLQIGRAEVGFLYNPERYPHVVEELRFHEDLFLVSAGHANLTPRQTVPLVEMADLPLVGHASPSITRSRVNETAMRHGISLRWIFEIDSLAAIKQLVVEGDCHAILPMAAFWQEAATGHLVAARIVDPHVFLPLALVSSRSGVVSLPTKKLIVVIRDVIQSSAKSGIWSGRLVPRVDNSRTECRRRTPMEATGLLCLDGMIITSSALQPHRGFDLCEFVRVYRSPAPGNRFIKPTGTDLRH